MWRVFHFVDVHPWLVALSLGMVAASYKLTKLTARWASRKWRERQRARFDQKILDAMPSGTFKARTLADRVAANRDDTVESLQRWQAKGKVISIHVDEESSDELWGRVR
jgi:hypothetical protein